MKTKTNFLSVVLLTVLMALGSGLTTAQDDDNPNRRRGTDGRRPMQREAKQDTEKNEKKNEKKKEEPKPITAIVGGDIHTVTGSVIRGGTILIQDGKILELGQAIKVPDGATTIDAAGKVITPGFVAINMSRLGVRTVPQNRDKLADALDPYDRNMKFALGVGITTGCVEMSASRSRFGRRRNGEPEERFLGLDPDPEEFVSEALLDYGDEDTSLCPCCGLPVLPTEPITPRRPTQPQPRKFAALKMSFGHLDSMLVEENVFYSPNPGGLTGPLNRHNWRRDILKAKKAIEEEAKKTETKRPESSDKKDGETKTETGARSAPSSRAGSRSSRGNRPNPELIRLLKHEIALRISADTVGEISDMVDLANELDYDLVIEGGTEAWLVAKDVGEADAQIIYTPRRRRTARRGQEKTSGSNVESPGIFQEAGIPFAVSALSSSISMGGIAGRDLSSLPLEAAFAVRGGADEKTSLKSITITPARMLGLDDRIGSIEVGKDADLLILNGPPLDYRTYVEQAIVEGNVCYDRAKDKVYPVFDRKY